MNEVLPVAAIRQGTVIDHIIAGQAFRIVQLLGANIHKQRVTIGLHLPSLSLGSKDLIKIENRILTEQEASLVSVFSPLATMNVIQDFSVARKIKTEMPVIVRNLFVCPNPMCITQVERVPSCFRVKELSRKMLLTCHYCEKSCDRDELQFSESYPR